MTDTDPNPKSPPVTYESLVSTLIWPRLLRCPAMALAPRRLGLGIAAAMLIVAIARVGDALGVGFDAELTVMEAWGGLGAFVLSVLGPAYSEAPSIAREGVYEPLSEALRTDPVGFAGLFLAMLAVWSVASAGVARSTAMETARGHRLGLMASLRYGLTGGRAAFAAMLLPILIASILAMAAWGAASIAPWLAIVAFLMSILLVALLALHTIAWAMIPPAVACERTDAADAIQRVYAYILSVPLRALVYGTIVLAVSAIAHLVLKIILSTSAGLALSLGALDENSPPGRFVRAVTPILLSGYALSLVFTSGTAVYLLLRRVCDEQDVTDVMIEPPGRLLRSGD